MCGPFSKSMDFIKWDYFNLNVKNAKDFEFF